MYRTLLLTVLLLSLSNYVFSAIIKGRVSDQNTGEELVGATIYISGLNKGIVSGLDGSFIIRNI